MKTKMLYVIMLLITIMGMFACSNETQKSLPVNKEQKQNFANFQAIDSLIFGDTAEAMEPDEDYGRVVKIKYVQGCLDRYASLMKKHGFDTAIHPATEPCLTETDKITYAESFRGRELMKFLTAAARRRAGILNGRKNTTIRVAFGAYTEEYLREYTKNMPTEKASKIIKAKENRIAVFLVSYKRNAQNKFVIDPAFDDDAFDFGDLIP